MQQGHAYILSNQGHAYILQQRHTYILSNFLQQGHAYILSNRGAAQLISEAMPLSIQVLQGGGGGWRVKGCRGQGPGARGQGFVPVQNL